MVLLTDLGETPLFKPSPSYKQQSFPYIIDCFFFHLLLFIGNWEKNPPNSEEIMLVLA